MSSETLLAALRKLTAVGEPTPARSATWRGRSWAQLSFAEKHNLFVEDEGLYRAMSPHAQTKERPTPRQAAADMEGAARAGVAERIPERRLTMDLTQQEKALADAWKTMTTQQKADVFALDPAKYRAMRAAYLKSRASVPWSEMDADQRSEMFLKNPAKANELLAADPKLTAARRAGKVV